MGQIVFLMLAGICFKEVGRTAIASIDRSVNLSDEVAERRRSVRAEEERVEREGWIVNG